MYKEPYYILFRKSNPNKIDQHTIPSFIPVNVLEELYLPEKTQVQRKRGKKKKEKVRDEKNCSNLFLL
jgi:hypothetical protein